MCFLRLPSLKQQEIHKRIGLKFKDVIIMICESWWSKNMIVGFKISFWGFQILYIYAFLKFWIISASLWWNNQNWTLSKRSLKLQWRGSVMARVYLKWFHGSEHATSFKMCSICHLAEKAKTNSVETKYCWLEREREE